MIKKISVLVTLVIILGVVSYLFKNSSSLSSVTQKCGPQPTSIEKIGGLNTKNWKTVTNDNFGYTLKTPSGWLVSYIQNGTKNIHLSRQGGSIVITEIENGFDARDCGLVIELNDRRYNIEYDFDRNFDGGELWIEEMDKIVSTIEPSSPTMSSPGLNYDTIYKVDGYYSTYDQLMYPLDYDPEYDPYPATTTCSVFTVLHGNNEVISYFKDQIARGNTVNRLDEIGNLVLNLDLGDITSLKHEELLLESNKQEQVSLDIKVKRPLGKGANYCQSMITIVSVQ